MSVATSACHACTSPASLLGRGTTELCDLLEGCTDISVMVIDSDGVLVDYNSGASAMFGVGDGYSWRGRRLSEFCVPIFADAARKWLQRVTSSGRSIHIEHIFRARRLSTTISPRSETSPGEAIVVSNPGGAIVAVPQHVESVATELVDIGPLDALSKRELEILLLLGQGLRITEVSKRLHRSDRTIETHRHSIGDKLGFGTRADIVRFVTSNGLTPELSRQQAVSVLRPRVGERNSK